MIEMRHGFLTRPPTRAELLELASSGESIDDDWFKYFETVKCEDWIDVAKEGLSMIAALGEWFEEDSDLSNVVHAVSAKASSVAFEKIAKVLGVSGRALELAVEEFIDCDAGAEALVAEAKACEELV